MKQKKKEVEVTWTKLGGVAYIVLLHYNKILWPNLYGKCFIYNYKDVALNSLFMVVGESS